MRICTRHRRDGSALIVVLALLAFLFAYLALNVVTLQRLSQEVRAVEKRQVQRLHASGVPGPAEKK